MFPGAYTASLMVGTVSGMIVGDVLGAIPTPAAVPATSSAAKPKTTAAGTPVTGDMTARQIVFLSAFYVIVAMLILILGARVLKDARIA